MLMKELLDQLSKPGQTVAAIAKQIDGIGEKRLKKALNQAGYQFRNQAPKGWFFAGEGAEPLDKSIFDYTTITPQTNKPRMSKNVKLNSHEIHPEATKKNIDDKSNVKSDSPKRETNVNDYSKLMYEELKAIRGLLQPGKPKERQIVSNNLLERISGLNPNAEKVRKTIVIDETISKQLDQFAKKKRVTKSDLLEVALLDLFEKYGG